MHIILQFGSNLSSKGYSYFDIKLSSSFGSPYAAVGI